MSRQQYEAAEFFVNKAVEAAAPINKASIQALGEMLLTLLKAPPTAPGAPQSDYVISVGNAGFVNAKGMKQLAELLQMSPSTCAARLSQSQGTWRMVRQDPVTREQSLEIIVERGSHPSPDPRAASLLASSLPMRVGRARSKAVQKQKALARARNAALPRGTNRLKAVYENSNDPT